MFFSPECHNQSCPLYRDTSLQHFGKVMDTRERTRHTSRQYRGGEYIQRQISAGMKLFAHHATMSRIDDLQIVADQPRRERSFDTEDRRPFHQWTTVTPNRVLTTSCSSYPCSGMSSTATEPPSVRSTTYLQRQSTTRARRIFSLRCARTSTSGTLLPGSTYASSPTSAPGKVEGNNSLSSSLGKCRALPVGRRVARCGAKVGINTGSSGRGDDKCLFGGHEGCGMISYRADDPSILRFYVAC